MRNTQEADTATTGQILETKMKERGYGKRRLARESGISYRTICRIISGDMVGSLHTWSMIARALECKISDLTGE